MAIATVKELRKALEGYPDDSVIHVVEELENSSNNFIIDSVSSVYDINKNSGLPLMHIIFSPHRWGMTNPRTQAKTNLDA